MGTKLNQTDGQGLEQGLWKVYWFNGNLWSKGSYLNGKKDGVWEFYWEHGNLHCKGSFLDGKQIGTREDYDKEGILIEVTYYH